MPFRALLKELVLSVEGATGAIFLASDGEAVQWHENRDSGRLQLRAAYIAVVLRGARATADSMKVASIGYLALEYDGARFIVQEIDRGYFIALELDLSANIGQAIYRIRLAVERFRREVAA